MKIGVIGANGKAGQLVVKEALNRGHEVIGFVRDSSKVSESIEVKEIDVFHLSGDDVKGFDAVVSAYGAFDTESFVRAGDAFIKAFSETDTPLIIIGGAGSLYVDKEKGLRLLDTPDFPEAYKPIAKGADLMLEKLLETTSLTWTYMSPAAFFDAEGKRTGTYTKGKDQLILNQAGESYISYADFAIAVLDEVEQPQHRNERFTVVGNSSV
ncbi:NAD(P)-dependent oxidoreductase [Shouchella lehensis]|uniref:NAD(P)-dependent oxidoreductase n=1 Tax=Shouchella lehensis TaxID=300825 RepID=A0A4Y7WFA2_9BACI|nr:NAD(P)-dependent oxidoreductase [Shouchella lehensis]MBG9785005.1 hypothetical protein [Shouchella lehensis]TES46428.1 NAD(P)-dependent oxidoreductase [Shouchella lehensis]